MSTSRYRANIYRTSKIKSLFVVANSHHRTSSGSAKFSSIHCSSHAYLITLGSMERQYL
jgi:hypothetical protein